MTGQKGPGDFLSAAKLLLEQGRRDVQFTIAGDGDLLTQLKRRATEWGISRHVRFLGRVVGRDQLACYRQASVFVLPSLSEPFGLTVLEAMAAGLPAIITHTTGAGEVVENVIRVHANDPEGLAQAIASLLDSADLRRKIGQSGSLEVEQFDWARVASKTYEVYMRVLHEWREERR